VRARVPVVNLDGSDTAAGVVLTVAQPSLVAATIARLLTDTAFAAGRQFRATYQARSTLGTVAYMSPEQVTAKSSINVRMCSRSAWCFMRWPLAFFHFQAKLQAQSLGPFLNRDPVAPRC